MTHALEEEILGAYLDGELGPAQQAAIEAHLEACPRCRQVLSELRALHEMLDAWPAPASLPAQDAAFRLESLASLPPRRRRAAGLLFPAGAAVFVAFMQAVGVVTLAVSLTMWANPWAEGERLMGRLDTPATIVSWLSWLDVLLAYMGLPGVDIAWAEGVMAALLPALILAGIAALLFFVLAGWIAMRVETRPASLAGDDKEV